MLERRGWTSAVRRIRTALIGRPISSEHESHERFTKLKALAIFSSDNISSSAYATEEMMRILVLGGISALSLSMPITSPSSSSWRSSPRATRRRSRPIPTAPRATSWPATTSARCPASPPPRHCSSTTCSPWRCRSPPAWLPSPRSCRPCSPTACSSRSLIVVVLMLGNLRGIRESGSIFMAPTYLYIGAIAALIVLGPVPPVRHRRPRHVRRAARRGSGPTSRARLACSACSCCCVPSARARPR